MDENEALADTTNDLKEHDFENTITRINDIQASLAKAKNVMILLPHAFGATDAYEMKMMHSILARLTQLFKDPISRPIESLPEILVSLDIIAEDINALIMIKEKLAAGHQIRKEDSYSSLLAYENVTIALRNLITHTSTLRTYFTSRLMRHYDLSLPG
jgi:hypothetical protein